MANFSNVSLLLLDFFFHFERPESEACLTKCSVFICTALTLLVFPSNLCSPVRVLIGMLLFWLFLNVKEPDVGYFGRTGRL